jgi:hypothetical protein
MSKKLLVLFSILLLFTFLGISNATTVTWDGSTWNSDSGNYQTPEGWTEIASVSPIDLEHSSFYEWTLTDLDPSVTQVDIVFHGIYNFIPGGNYLNVYIKDRENVNISPWEVFGVDLDNSSLNLPDWSSWTKIGGTWSDPVSNPSTVYDLVFTIEGDALNNLLNGNTFIIGIDPDCHFAGDKISVVAPVPEPTTMLLFGSGLIGLGAFGRRKFFKRG